MLNLSCKPIEKILIDSERTKNKKEQSNSLIYCGGGSLIDLELVGVGEEVKKDKEEAYLISKPSWSWIHDDNMCYNPFIG